MSPAVLLGIRSVLAVTVAAAFAVPARAAPVPKEISRRSSTAARLVGTWQDVDAEPAVVRLTFAGDGTAELRGDADDPAASRPLASYAVVVREADPGHPTPTVEWETVGTPAGKRGTWRVVALTADELEYRNAAGRTSRFRRVIDADK